MARFPSFLEGQVVSHDVPNRRVIVNIPSTQMLGIGVKLLIHGPADAVRVKHDAMPGRGTWGLIAFPYGRPENGIWLGSFFPALQTALTSDNDPFVEYNAHFSGAYEHIDASGSWIKSFPDGTWLQVGAVSGKPNFYRQVVDDQQNQQRIQFTDAQRVANPPSNPYTFTVNHGSGAKVTIDPQGNVSIAAKSGQLVSINADTISLNAATQVSVLAPTVAMNGNLQVSGSVIGGFSGADQINLQTHRHGTTGTAAGQTVPPTPGT